MPKHAHAGCGIFSGLHVRNPCFGGLSGGSFHVGETEFDAPAQSDQELCAAQMWQTSYTAFAGYALFGSTFKTWELAAIMVRACVKAASHEHCFECKGGPCSLSGSNNSLHCSPS